jgi:hypothetical protein
MLVSIRLLCVVTAGILASLLGGCATVVNGTTQTIPVSSSPSGASIFADGRFMGTTPCQVELSRRTSHVLSFEKEGYEPTSVAISREISAMTAGNVLIGGLIGLGVDAVSGANYRLVPESISVSLERSTASVGDDERTPTRPAWTDAGARSPTPRRVRY